MPPGIATEWNGAQTAIKIDNGFPDSNFLHRRHVLWIDHVDPKNRDKELNGMSEPQ